jgi:HAD superfamily hydrolase (TIGR01509 family)
MDIFNFKLYIFDFDGIIIDSEKIHFESYKKSLEQNNIYQENFNFEKYCEINHSIDKNISFEKIYKEKYLQIYNKKKDHYLSKINNINFIDGFEEFFKELIKRNKLTAIVTDASKELLKQFINKFPLLNKFQYVITRDDVNERKPSSEGYLKVLQKYSHIDYNDIIGFEDSYKGIISMSKIIYHTICVNNDNYFYYDKIVSLLNFKPIKDFKYINSYLLNNYENSKIFYISSKTKYANDWKYINNHYKIVSNWINVNKTKEELSINNKQTLCNQIFSDITSCDFLVFFTNEDMKDHYGSILEIGIALTLHKKIYICGNNLYSDEILFNFKDIIDHTYINYFDINKVLYLINLNNTEKYLSCKDNYKNLLTKKNIIVNKKNEILDYLVISASGKGSRLLPLTAQIPKILVSYNNDCLLNNIVNYWKIYTKKFIIIINKCYNIIVKFYLDLLNVDYEIINVELINNYENSYTINQALTNEKFLNKKIVITWCDIYPNIKFDENIFNDENIIFTYKNYGRYEANNNNLIKKEYGNVIGIYYFSKFKFLSVFDPTMDLCDCFKENFGNFQTFEIPDLIDIGDMEKLIIFINSNNDKYITRYFNKIIEIDNNKLLKKSTCEYGNNIIEKESYFYKFHEKFEFKPKIYEFGENYFIMEKIKETNQVIYYFNNSLQYKQFEILKKCLNIVEKLHNEQKIDIDSNTLLKDINIEFKSKINNRLEKITPLLYYFSFLKNINGMEIKSNHNEIIQKLSNNIILFFKNNTKNYCTIHGDCHLSNILVDSSENYYLIDPRGYFGETTIFGIEYYDIGKILYSLSGFDELNNRKNHYFIIEKDNIIVNVNNNMDNYLFLFENYNTSILIDMVILHWLGLAEYSKNNIHKCISAYYYGIYLYQKYYIK